MKMSTLLIQNIGQLLLAADHLPARLEGVQMRDLPFIKNAFLSLENGLIKDYGTMSECPTYPFDEYIDAANRIVFPAWCDSHTHLVFGGSRELEFVDKIKGLSYAEIAAKGGGILNSAAKLANTSESALYDSALERIHAIIRTGTGAVEIKSGYGLSLEAELKMLRVIRRLKETQLLPIRATFLGAHAFPTAYKECPENYIQAVIEQMLPRVADEGLADYFDVFCERGFFSVADTDKLLEAAAKYGLRPKIHANQLDFSGGVQIGVKHRALSVDHLEHAGAAEIQALMHSETIGTLLPTAAFFLRLPYPPARAMIDAGLGIALATDFNPGSSPSGRMPWVLTLACLYMRMLPEEALAAATLNGAYAMDFSDSLGSISRGKVANLCISKPIQDFAYIPYSFGEDCIEKVLIKGKIM
jgi:imidazolonepropionase